VEHQPDLTDEYAELIVQDFHERRVDAIAARLRSTLDAQHAQDIVEIESLLRTDVTSRHCEKVLKKGLCTAIANGLPNADLDFALYTTALARQYWQAARSRAGFSGF
jgi:hypothetical protein